MHLHEYQAKQFFQQFNIPIPKGDVAYTPDQAVEIAKTIGGDFWIVKAQIHAGGRGKAGGILKAHSLEEVKNATLKILNKPLITPQTTAAGQVVNCVYVEQGCSVEQEFYLSLSLDRRTSQLCAIISAAGGTSIEEVARNTPEAIEKIFIDPFLGIQPYHLRLVQKRIHLSPEKLRNLIHSLYQIYTQFDANLIEINPLALTKEGQVVALDAKMSWDNNAAYRQPLLQNLDIKNQQTLLEKKAQEQGFNYVELIGDIACMVNGAGLAMATMDLIHHYGGKPANFLDIGGTADQERIQIALELIIKSPSIKVVLINIFGGIVQCDMIANSIVAVAKEHSFNIPFVVRLEGSGSGEARKILSESGLSIIPVDNLEDAARAVINVGSKINL